jgi:signal transduction histidine kinase
MQMVTAESPRGGTEPSGGALDGWQAVIGIAIGEPMFDGYPVMDMDQGEPPDHAYADFLVREVFGIQEAERRRLARELHDTVGQALVAVRLDLESLRREPRRLIRHRRLDACLAIVDQAMESVRDFALELRPPVLDDLGLVAATRWYSRRQSKLGGFRVAVASNGEASGFGTEIETACFRVLQEALTNVVRHSRATRVRVELAGMDDVLVLTVVDNGIGFDTGPSRPSPGSGLGLAGMRERTRHLGGSLEVISEVGRGARIVARFSRSADIGIAGVA